MNNKIFNVNEKSQIHAWNDAFGRWDGSWTLKDGHECDRKTERGGKLLQGVWRHDCIEPCGLVRALGEIQGTDVVFV